MSATKQFRVEFVEVGRNKRSFTEDFVELDETKLANCARKNAGLMSRDIEFSESEEPFSGHAHGSIHAGMHTVGKWRAYRLVAQGGAS